MLSSMTMAKIITQIAAAYGLDLTRDTGRLRLENPPYMRLTIEKLSRNLVSVAHYYEQNGDLVADPDAVFYTGINDPLTGTPLWVPMELTQSFGGFRRYVRIERTASGAEQLVCTNLASQQDLARFCNVWAKNIRQQGYLTATNATPVKER